MAQRHVAEGSRRVAAQRAIIVDLEYGGHYQLAAVGRAVLATLETSLKLARWDLAIIESGT